MVLIGSCSFDLDFANIDSKETVTVTFTNITPYDVHSTQISYTMYVAFKQELSIAETYVERGKRV